MFDKKCFGRFRPSDHLTDQMTVSESGFYIKLLNGYRVRVEWGPGCNCDNHYERPRAGHWWASTTAEVAVYESRSQKMRSIHAWQTEDQVRAIIDETSKLLDEEVDDEDCCCGRSVCSMFVRASDN